MAFTGRSRAKSICVASFGILLPLARKPLCWQPQMKLVRGIWNIPIPSERNPVQPTVLLVPLLGFDPAGYRLGYGGGYYDRTLATFAQKPLSIGIGYELGRLKTIYPQPHDVSMDGVVTESGVVCRQV